MDWSTAPAFGRTEHILATLHRLYEFCPQSPCIVETGCLRGDELMIGDGWSTLAWGWFCSQTGGHAHTVDHTPLHLDVCRRLTADYAVRIEYNLGDSHEFLSRWVAQYRGPIHLMYHDAMDYLPNTVEASSEHHRREAEIIFPSLAPQCLVCFDDCNAEGGGYVGKGRTAIPWYLERGFQLEWSRGDWNAGGQVLLSRGLS